MYEQHPVCRKPADEHVKIWHYMDFRKFVSLLHNETLFFAKASKLLKDDPFEGAFPKNGCDPDVMQYFELADHKNTVAVNCWHMNAYESNAMWKLYGDSIAICSTFRRLADSLYGAPEGVFIGIVEYIDYEFDTTRSAPDNMLTYLLHKRPDFGYESELRALTVLDPSDDAPDSLAEIDGGVGIHVNLDTLIDKIYVSPRAERWVTDVVQSVTGKYALVKPVERSKLLDPPESAR
jgi:hypothetical protein